MAKAPRVKKNVIKEAVELASKGSFDAANEIIKKNSIKEEVFLDTIAPTNYSVDLFNFVSKFKDPDWHMYVQKMNETKALEFVHLANKNKIDLLEMRHNRSLLDSMIYTNSDAKNAFSGILEIIDDKVIRTAFLNPEHKYSFINLIRHTEYRDHHWASKGVLPAGFTTILTKLNSVEIGSSENCETILTTNNDFTKILFNGSFSVNYLKSVLDEYKDFFGKHSKVILDTFLLKKLASSNNKIERDAVGEFDKIIENKSFNPNLNLLPANFTNAIECGRFNVTFGNEKYRIFKELVKEKLLFNEKYNNPEPDNLTVYERFLVENFHEQFYYPKDYPLIKEIFEEAKSLEKIGLEKKCAKYTFETIDNMFSKSLGNQADLDKHELHSELDHLSYKLHMPPFILEELVEFFDKRYGFKLNNEVKEEVNQDEVNIKKAWADLMAETVFTQEIKEENKKSAKP